MSSAGIVHFDNVLVALFVKPFLSRASLFMHITCLDLFLHRYHLERVTLLV